MVGVRAHPLKDLLGVPEEVLDIHGEVCEDKTEKSTPGLITIALMFDILFPFDMFSGFPVVSSC